MFIQKSILFVAPFLIAYVISINMGSLNKGDLLRMGYLIDHTGNYRDSFGLDQKEKILYSTVSRYRSSTHIFDTTYDLLTIGDSFSQQKGYGYQNKLVEMGYQVLHFDQSDNAMQVLQGLINGDFFQKVKVRYVLVQSIERFFPQRGLEVDPQSIIDIENYTFTPYYDFYVEGIPEFFSASVIKLPLYNLLYLFDDNAFLSEVYKVRVTEQLFSTDNKRLLFYEGDVKQVPTNNNLSKIKSLNEELNRLEGHLAKLGIKLIVLPSPDKFDVYYKYIENRNRYPKPLFFDYLKKQKMNYYFIDSKTILQSLITQEKDLYFYDDTHWTPLATQHIAEEISRIITH